MAKSKAPKSRAARRAASPPANIGPFPRLPSPDVKEKVAVLGVRGDAGVKKSKKKKQLSSKQKARREAAVEKAEAAMEKLARKTHESKMKGKTVQARRGNWEVLNGKIEEELGEALAEVPDLKK